MAEVRTHDLPATVDYRKQTIRIADPEDEDTRALGGSGGPMLEITIRPATDAPPVRFVVQATGLAVLDGGARPAFEVWSNAGGGTYTRCVMEWTPAPRRYCCPRVDEFADHGDEHAGAGAVTMPGTTHVVRFERSRRFGCEPN